VLRKINLILADLKALRKYAQMELSTFLADSIHQVVVERYLERIIGRMIDINYHLVTELGADRVRHVRQRCEQHHDRIRGMMPVVVQLVVA